MTPPLHSIISRLPLKQLRPLVALGEHSPLLKAWQQVALTQPGASKALQEIETTFGTPLFVRTNRGLEPNAVGHCVIRYAHLIQTDLAHLREEIGSRFPSPRLLRPSVEGPRSASFLPCAAGGFRASRDA